MRKILLCFLATVLFSAGTPAFAGDVQVLENAIKAWTKEATLPTYKHAFVDLNDDGIADAVVLITDNQYCGSGGCSFIVFQGVADGLKLVSSSTITRESILFCCLKKRRGGTHCLYSLPAVELNQGKCCCDLMAGNIPTIQLFKPKRKKMT